jgi:uncharacterized protein
MATYFLDTSALVKRHVAEPGHAWVRALCNPHASNTIVVGQIALVEVIATFSRMVRETPRRLTIARRDRVIADFEARYLRQYTVVQVDHTLLSRAAALCRAHPLRAYDAVQVACALTRRDDDLAAGDPAPTFVCADAGLLAIAQAEGLTVENPNSHP